MNYHELEFVLGALESIRRFRPAMLVEVGTNPDTTVAGRILDILRGEGYEAYDFDGARLRLGDPAGRSQNWFFLRPSHLALLNERCPQVLPASQH